MHPVLGVVIAYLAGSIPFAFLAGKARGIDLREHGSGNLGATNAMRVLGPRIGGLVYLGDTLKGALPALLLPMAIQSSHGDLWAIAFGVAAILGHVKPVFLLGQGGGKGVATAGGVFFGLAWLPALIALVAFVVVVGITRYVSAGSITAAIVLPLAILVVRGPHALFFISAAVSVFVIWMHRANISRLLKGTESRIGTRKEAEAA
ncbi:MAG TPA: glycerol-3-phosphate 1-O-acyltransferase PlsY [Gemmatimonadaceae bacterium]|nr:glycerol-3-phosphate 1-O-acyltransferase PlsY [Gemmatimonadaceae bacterium]